MWYVMLVKPVILHVRDKIIVHFLGGCFSKSTLVMIYEINVSLLYPCCNKLHK